MSMERLTKNFCEICMYMALYNYDLAQKTNAQEALCEVTISR